MKLTVDQFLRSSRSTPSVPSPSPSSAAASISSPSSAPSSPSKVPARPPLIRNGAVPPSTPPRLPSTPSTGRIRFAPEPVKERVASPRKGKARAKAVGQVQKKGKGQCEVAHPAFEIPSEHAEICAFLVDFVRRYPSTKATVQRHFDFLNLELTFLDGGRKSAEIAAALIAARAPVKVATPRLSPYVSPKPAHNRLKRFKYTPSGLTRQVALKPVKGAKAKTSAARARMLLDKRWNVRYSQTSPRMLSPLEAQAVELVKAYFRTTPHRVVPSPSIASPSPSPLATSSTSVEASSRSASSVAVERCAPSVWEKDLPPVPEEPMCFYDSASSRGVQSNTVRPTRDIESEATAEAELSLGPSPPPERPSISSTLNASEDGGVSVEHVADVADHSVRDVATASPKSPVATIPHASTDDSTPRTSVRSRAIARIISGISARREAKASLRKSDLVGVGLGIIGIGLGLATTSMPSTSDLATMSTAPPSSPDLATAATFERSPAPVDANIGTSVGFSCVTGLSRDRDMTLPRDSNTRVSESPGTATPILRRQNPLSAASPNCTLSNPISPSVDLDGVNEGKVVHPREPLSTGTSGGGVDKHHSTRHGRGLASLLDSMARSLMGSWFKV